MNLAQDFPIDVGGDIVEGCYNDLDETILRSKAVRLLPTRRQRSKLKQWFVIYKQGYNFAVKQLRKHFRENPNMRPPSFYTFRNQIRSILPETLRHSINKSGIPKHTFWNSVNDVLKNWKSANALLQKGHTKKFLIRYVKNTKKKLSMVFEPSSFSKNNKAIAYRQLGCMQSVNNEFRQIRNHITDMIKSDKLQSVAHPRKDHECRMVWDMKTSSIKLYVPLEKKLKETIFRDQWCSLDPGLRVFQTLYSPTSKADLGVKDRNRIKSILDRIRSREKFSDQPWFVKYKKRLMTKISDIRDNMHWSIARKLVQSYDTILLGSMSTKSICRRGGNLHKINKQLAYSLSHSKFRTKLMAKAEEFGSQVIIVNEYLTSKTCGGCFKTYNCGSSKRFNCTRCPYRADRDLNAARNIALKHFGLFAPIIRHVR